MGLRVPNLVIVAYLITTVRGQIVACKDSVTCNCAGGPGVDLGMMSPRDCCVNTPGGCIYIASNGSCVPCIVIGFLEGSFSGIEQRQPYVVQIGYLKGADVARQDFELDVGYIENTASRDNPQRLDFSLITTTVTVSSHYTESVRVTFHVDGIAQEPNETFNLTLNPVTALTQRDGLFFLNTTQLTIFDSDNVEVFFTEDNFLANEAVMTPIVVSKTTRIASRIELVVIPLTVQEARAISLPLPLNIPQDNPHSPPFADQNDFNKTNITLIFEPDEDSELSELRAPIFVSDDSINEATEQVFVVELILVDSLNPATVNLITRPVSLCRIIDNDPIRIEFELPSYTYEEPQFEEFIDQSFMSPTGRLDNGPIYLVKKDDVFSEQNFQVTIQVMDSAPNNYGSSIQPATFGADYLLSGTSFTQTFPAFEQRIIFLITLLTDDLAEGTEAFQASVTVSPADNLANLTFNPAFLSSSTYVIIEDNDPIIIGFVNTSYAVRETAGILQIDVQVFSPSDDQPLQATINLVIQTVSGSATGGSDYQEISATTLDILLTFDSLNRQQSFNVAITNDSFFESDSESFSLHLRFDSLSNVILSPNVSSIHILDDDAVVIGFLNTYYTVDESDYIQIGVIQGSLQRLVMVDVTIILITESNDYGEFSQQYTFDSTTSIINVQVPIMGVTVNNIFELTEYYFSAGLSFPDAPIPRVTLAPDYSQITVKTLDDNGQPVTQPTEINSLTITIIAVVVVCAVVFLIPLTAIIIMIYTVLKKKAKRSKEQEQDASIYESISDTFTGPMKCDWAPNKPLDDNVYDEIKAIKLFKNTTEFELTDNEAYSSFKPSAAPAVPLNTISAEL